jgi:Ca-activated chloride channel family protein
VNTHNLERGHKALLNTIVPKHISIERRFLLSLISVIILVLPQLALADGMMFPPPHRDIPQVFSVKYHHVDVAINAQAAVTSVDQVFHNDSAQEQEGLYMFPLLEGSAINRFSMYDGNKEIEGRILEKAEARQLYESIVRKRKDPALLEYVGRNTFQARVYPIPANGDKRIKLQYSEVLPKDGGMIKYVYPLSTERFSAKPLENVRITVKLSAKIPIMNIYSPTHEVDVKQSSPTEVIVEWRGSNIKPDRDLVLYYSLSDDEFPIQVLTHHEPGEPGYFMLLASPKPDANLKPIPKDVVFVLDRTGSMSGDKIEQAKSALKYCLNALKPYDRFNLVTFNENATWFKDGLAPANKENIAAAVKMVDETDARGGTDINRAMRVALAQYAGEKSGQHYIVFLTDGLPTVGETDVDKIQKNIVDENKSDVRIFAFGVGYDVNTQFLDSMTRASKADADYVRPEEDIEVKVTAFYDKISDPVLSDVKLIASGVKVEDMYPSEPLPDMFKGGQLIVIGKYDGAGQGIFTLSGIARGKQQTYKETVELPTTNADNDFIPRLWATRKIGYLLDEIRLHRNQELIDEVVKLSRDFGIPTEFTSFIADEKEGVVPLNVAIERATKVAEIANATYSGTWSQAQSQNARSMRNQSVVAGAPQRQDYIAGPQGPAGTGGYNSYDGSGFGNVGYIDSTGQRIEINTIQNVGTRTFYRKSNQWIDARYGKQMVYNIRQYSEAHFQLLDADPELRKYSTLGEVTVVVNGNAIQIGATGQEKLTKKEINTILGRA